MRLQSTGGVVQVGGLQGQFRAAVDLPARAVVQQCGDIELLVTTAGENAVIAVVEAGGLEVQTALAGQGTFVAVLQDAAQDDGQIAVTAGKGAKVAVVETLATDTEALPTGEQAALVAQLRAAQAELTAADELASAVVEVAQDKDETLAAADFAALVRQIAQVLEVERAMGEDQTVLVIQVTVVEVQDQAGGAD
ncbi:hypothetical protein D9M70_504250 [compost metagenome]